MKFLYDGKYYDIKYRNLTQDIPFWIDMARRYGDPVLELACGTGRISIPLAREGFRVTGIDISDSMISRAREKLRHEDLSVEWVNADMRDFHLGKKYSLILLPFNSICHLLELRDLEGCLSCVKEHLKPYGRLIIDVFTPSPEILCRRPEERYPNTEFPDPNGRGIVEVTESNYYDGASQINRTRLFFKFPGKKEEFVEELDMRMYFPQELEAILKYNGFKIEHKYGSYDLSEFSSQSPKQIIICSK